MVQLSAEQQRKRCAKANYGQNTSGNWVRKKAWRECDYTDEGRLKEFDTEEAFLQFEEERSQRGPSQAQYEKKPRNTVPKDQLALEETITNVIVDDGNETRVYRTSVR